MLWTSTSVVAVIVLGYGPSNHRHNVCLRQSQQVLWTLIKEALQPLDSGIRMIALAYSGRSEHSSGKFGTVTHSMETDSLSGTESTWGASLDSNQNGEFISSSYTPSVDRPTVYTPPGARTVQADSVSTQLQPHHTLVTTAVVLRGEDFRSLQASLPLSPANPQQQQKELQQRQREKRQELKEQHVKLHELITLTFAMAFCWVTCKLCRNKYVLDGTSIKKQSGKKGSSRSSFRREKVGPELEEPNTFRAEIFSFQELQQATCEFVRENELGKGSFSCVYTGFLGDGRVVEMKRALGIANKQDSKEFRNELDLLSRLKHAHLLNLLGFSDDGRERLLVYELMANGTLHEQLHGKSEGSLNWVIRVTIAVQTVRGLEYLLGYACPSVIHRDVKFSNILLDDEWNARVSDFGLSLLGSLDSDSPIWELPAGTLDYLDPEYYKLMGTQAGGEPILPSKVVLGSSRLHKRQPSSRSLLLKWSSLRLKGNMNSELLLPLLFLAFPLLREGSLLSRTWKQR